MPIYRFFLGILGLWLISASLFGQSNLRVVHLNPGDRCFSDARYVAMSSVVFPDSLKQERDMWVPQDDGHGMCRREALSAPITILFRVYPFPVADTLWDKTWNIRRVDSVGFPSFMAPINRIEAGVNQVFGTDEKLQKRGSLTRGVAFGNANSASLISAFNLQLNGELGQGIRIDASITDENLPIQPEGNTQQLQDFDQVFVRLSKGKQQLTAGDFNLPNPNTSFLSLRKRGQGIMAEGELPLKLLGMKRSSGQMKVQAAAAVARGKFRRQEFQAIEGNQGPYRLNGNDGEAYILVLSGTESVYINGEKMARGQEFDYVIDYSTAEITFTSRRILTKDMRLVVEFEYSDRRYQRWMVQAGQDIQWGPVQTRLQFFTEFDDGNQPVNQSLSDADKLQLALAGDSLGLSVSSTADSAGFSAQEIRYQKLDTLVAGQNYSIFQASANPNTAIWRLRFSFVGQGNGDYVPAASSSNGRTYTWVAPINGQPQGNYSPTENLVPPRLQHMLVFGVSGRNKGWKWSGEGALSQLDKNRFSPLNDKDNQGYAFTLELERPIPLRSKEKDTIWLRPKLKMEQVSADFAPFVRFRSVEFSRDWNLVNRNSPNALLQLNPQGNDYLPTVELSVQNGRIWQAGYGLDAYIKGHDFSALRHKSSASFRLPKWQAQWSGSFAQVKERTTGTSDFFRQSLNLNWTPSWGRISIKGQDEINPQRAVLTNAILPSSYAFHEYSLRIGSADTTRWQWAIEQQARLDRLPGSNQLEDAAMAYTSSASLTQNGMKGNRWSLMLSYRQLDILNQTLSNLQPVQNLLARMEGRQNWLKGAVQWNLFMETGSGLENRREEVFLPSLNGMGDHIWVDYNADGLQSRDEFELRQGTVVGTDGQTYVRIWLPSSEYVQAWYHRTTGQINARFPQKWSSKGQPKWKQWLGKWSAQSVYKTDRKMLQADFIEILNPIAPAITDSSLLTLNHQWRNSVYFNRFGGWLGLEYAYLEQRNKSWIAGGSQYRSDEGHRLKLRISPGKSLSVESHVGRLIKSNRAELLRSREFELRQSEAGTDAYWQQSTRWRVGLHYRYVLKERLPFISGGQAVAEGPASELHHPGISFKYNALKNGSIELRADYLKFDYAQPGNDPLSFEMLEGLQVGDNLTWSVQAARRLGEYLQLTVGYQGRKSPAGPIIHMGSAQVRAFF
jgi:hypothetical protein